MRVPPFERYRRLMQGSGLFFLVGVIVGCALFLAVNRRTIDLVYTRNLELQAQIEILHKEMKLLHKTSNRAGVIKKLDIRVLQGGKNTIDKGTEQELRRRVRDDLSIVLGRDSAAFGESYPLYEKLISGKVYHGILEKKNYTVTVRTMMLVQTELIVWINADVFKGVEP